MKKSCLVLKLCHFKVQCLDFPMKLGNLATFLLNFCGKLFFVKSLSYFMGGGGGGEGLPHVDKLFCDNCS